MLSQIDQPEVAVIVASKSLLNPGPDGLYQIFTIALQQIINETNCVQVF